MRAIASYKRTSIESAPNEELVVLLVEAALRKEDAAVDAMRVGDRTVWLRELHTARAIFVELATALDPKGDPLTVGALRDTYRWLLHHLLEAGRTGDLVRMAEVRGVTDTLRDTWTRALRIHRREDVEEASP